MIYEKLNIIDKFGVFQRILEDDKTLFDLLLLDLKYRDAVYYVVTDEEKYLGAITKDHLINIDKNIMATNPKLKQICNNPYPNCIPEEDYLNNEEIAQIHKFFIENSSIHELPIVSQKGFLIGIVSRIYYYSHLSDIRHDKTNPYISWDVNHFYKMNNNGLNKYARNVNPQHGEDGIIEKIFETIGFTNKYAVEFGGWDGIHLSNIRNLILTEDFHAVFIEGDPERSQVCKENYAENQRVKAVTGFVGFDKLKKLDAYLRENEIPKKFDLLSIDVDGYDYHIWESFVDFMPRVVIIEYNPTIANDIIFINPKNEDIRQGSSAAAIVSLGINKGYSLVAVTETNCIFVLDEEFQKLRILDNSLYALRASTPLSDSKYFQAYDKSLYYKGCDFFLWSNEKFCSNKFQMAVIQSKP